MNLSAARASSLRFPLLLLLLGATGCSSFPRDWKSAASPPAPTNSIEGRWEGSWRSDVNGHTGSLRCLISRGTNDTYSARFHAKYKKLIRFTFGYTVPLTVTPREGQFHFSGAADLGGLAGGLYTYQGRATPTNFLSTYSSKYDRGIFEMSRPAAAP